MASRKEPPESGINKLLAALPRRGRDRLLPNLKPVVLGFVEILYEPDEPIRYVYFPTSGMISLLLVLEGGSVAEVSRVGNEGMVGLPVFLGVRTSHTRAFVQIPGEALRMKEGAGFLPGGPPGWAALRSVASLYPSLTSPLGAPDGLQHLSPHRAATLPLAADYARPSASRPVRDHAGISLANVGRASSERDLGCQHP